MFEQFPRPWTCEIDKSLDYTQLQIGRKLAGGYTVTDANGKVVMFGGTYTGDGDAEFNLNRHQVKELVDIVNNASDTQFVALS